MSMGTLFTKRKSFLLSVVVPVYNEEKVLFEFYERTRQVLENMECNFEIIFVNDGSTDGSLVLMDSLRRKDPRIAIVDLSRNFGKEIALTAGLDHTSGDAVVVIDADLQDPPELIPKFVEAWLQGYDVVYGKRSKREGESVLKKVTAFLFYRVLQKTSNVKVPEDTGDYRLLSRRALNALGKLREHHRFMKGLFAWIGFPQKAILYDREPRAAGKTKWNYWRLWNLAIEGITSFTIGPLKIATYLGLSAASFSFVYGSYIILRTLLYGRDVPGYPSLIVIILFLGGIELIALGVIGEYLGRVFDETKNRPLYLVNEFSPSEAQGLKK